MKGLAGGNTKSGESIGSSFYDAQFPTHTCIIGGTLCDTDQWQIQTGSRGSFCYFLDFFCAEWAILEVKLHHVANNTPNSY